MPINYSNVELAVTAGLRDQFPRDNIVQIALSGRSNVGKSSFINRVCQRKKSGACVRVARQDDHIGIST